MFSINTECKDSARGKYSELVYVMMFAPVLPVLCILCIYAFVLPATCYFFRVKYTYFIDEMQPNYLFENEAYPG
jgi:hypothetical protein